MHTRQVQPPSTFFSRIQGILDKIQTDVAVRQHQQRTGKLVNMGSR